MAFLSYFLKSCDIHACCSALNQDHVWVSGVGCAFLVLEANMSNPMDRRDFLKSMAASGTVALTSLPVLEAAVNRSVAPGCKFFTVSQAALVENIAEQIVPADEHPGGKSAGVVLYIDGILAGRFGKFYKNRYEEGLDMVDVVSQKRFTRNFASLSPEQQISILKALESGDAVADSGRDFFALLLQHIMEGYYGDPQHGGNRDEASWKMIGFGG
jgi:gluconate 2-dehydrogenase gamma chain